MPDPTVDSDPGPIGQQSLVRRWAEFTARGRADTGRLLPGEHVGSFIVTLPKSSARQRASLLTYAVEDRIAAPIDSVTVAPGPLKGAPEGDVLALVCARRVLDDMGGGDTRLLPDFLLIPRPDAPEEGGAWAVWRDGPRAVVRVSDGTGFAAPLDTLALLWARAGKPELSSLSQPLPEGLPARDLSAAPPPPDPADLAFAFGIDRGAQGRSRRAGIFAVAAALLAGLLHLAFMAADTAALSRLADQTRSAAQAAIGAPLPGVTVTPDVAPILARLTPPPAEAQRGPFLPLLNDVTGALVEIDDTLTFRRLAWGAQDGALLVLAQAAGLDDLQRVQQGLEAQGFAVRSGAASAGDGGAEAELRISRGGS